MVHDSYYGYGYGYSNNTDCLTMKLTLLEKIRNNIPILEEFNPLQKPEPIQLSELKSVVSIDPEEIKTTPIVIMVKLT